ncbi:MAG: serine hydrolase [Proteobacteria bacterium]|nr:serine hydrolase [Pseudomonadota bacterium]
MRRPMLAAAAALVLIAPQPTGAQDTERHQAALVAGYKAAFLCSGVFNAGQTEAQVTADDLTGIYAEYREPIGKLPAVIDREARTVSVAFAPDMPPRIAAWRPGLGCTNLPIGARVSTVAALPRLEARPPRTNWDAQPWPTGDRGAEAPGPTPPALAALVRAAFDGASYGKGSKTTAVIVVADGRIVAEQYRAGYNKHTPQRTWSVGKSLAAAVVGAAVMDGLVDPKAPATVPEWRGRGDPRGAVTLDNLLRMSSGLYSGKAGNRTDRLYFGGTAVTEETVAQPLEAPPGSRWLYANNDTVLAVRAVRAAIGDDRRYLAYPFTDLFWRIGMARTTPETDWQGNFVLSSQVWTTARDLARFGLLHLNDGVWNGERVLPAGWVDYVTTAGPAQPPPGAAGAGPGYGAQWWLFGAAQGLPEDAYAAQGNRGQYLMVIPSRRMVVVRRGFDGTGERFEIARFSADVLRARK